MDNTTAPKTEITVKIILAIVVLLVVLITLFYFLIYRNFFLQFKSLGTLAYDKSAAQKIVNTLTPIAFTRNQDLFLGDLNGNEILLVPQNKNLTKKIASIKVSRSKKYIIWEIDTGLIKLNIASGKAFLIFSGEPRQSYDLSPVTDSILFTTQTELLEVNLDNGYIQKRFKLPKLEYPSAHFNHVKYSPKGQLAYVRTIHECCAKGIEDYIVDVANKTVKPLQGFSNSGSLAPLWQGEDSLIAWRAQGLITYHLANQSIETRIGKDLFVTLGAYTLSQETNQLFYLTARTKLPDTNMYINPTVFTVDQNWVNEKLLLESKDSQLGINFPTTIVDIGVLDTNTIWILVRKPAGNFDIWLLNSQNKHLNKALENISLYSLDSVYSSVVESYTLFK